jgi:hypothetical protein
MKVGRSSPKKHTYCEASGYRKIRFKTLTDAKNFRRWFLTETGVDSRVYRCSTCKGYHLTKKVDGKSSGTAWKHPNRGLS